MDMNASATASALTRAPSAGTLSRMACGYSIVIPPGWCRIPVRSGTDKAVRTAAREAASAWPGNAPPDRVGSHRVELERRLREAARDARRSGGIDLCLPVLPVDGTPLAASFVVSEVLTRSSARAVMAQASDDEARPVTISGTEGLRSERIHGPIPDRGIETGAHHVDYILPVPGYAGRWLVIAFSTLGAGDPEDNVAFLLTGLFDAMMTTFRWRWASP
jgi:hypothetical protein